MSENEVKVIMVGDLSINLPLSYNPLDDKGEYMNLMQLAYFKNILIEQMEKIKLTYGDILKTISSHNVDVHSADEADLGNIHEELFNELRQKDRARKLLVRIEGTILKIDAGNYGYCEKTGEEIGIRRLMFRPITKYCVEVQEALERNEMSFRTASAIDDINDVDDSNADDNE